MEYTYKFEEIDSCEEIGIFEDEYVYDIEMDDDTHTFIANDILVHNSCYVSFEEVLDKCDWKGTEKEFALELYKVRLEEYIETELESYAFKFNTDNYLKFEMESVAKKAIWLAKKKYIQDLVWKDPDVHFESLTKIKSKGFEVIQSSTPIFAREHLLDILKYIFAKDELNIGDIVKIMKDLKKKFKLENVERISKNLRINKYGEYVKNDTTDSCSM